jgi:hypothetical protein
MTKLGNLDTMLGGYFELCFIMIKIGSFDANFWDYFELFFILAYMNNLYTM